MKCSCSLTPVLALVGLAGLGFGGYNLMFGDCGTCPTDSASAPAAVTAASLDGSAGSECCASKNAECTADMGCGAQDESAFFVETAALETEPATCAEKKACEGKSKSDCHGGASTEVASKDQGAKSTQ